MNTQQNPTSIFLSYAKEDKPFKDKLLKHLSLMIRRNEIDVWDDEQIAGGQNWKEEIEKKLRTVHIAILLVSSDFLASDFINDFEIPILMERGKRGEVRIVPMLIRPVYFQGSEFSDFQGLPRSGQPISNWQNEDEAWISVVGDLVKIIEEKAKEVVNIASEKQTEKTWDVTKIRALISDGKLPEALNELDLIATQKGDQDFTDSLTILKSRLKQITRGSMLGLVSHQEELLERNKITYAVLGLLGDKF
ncbi:MAG: TIR domain-containing protein [Chitinophagales bacterium]